MWQCWEKRGKARLPQRALHAHADDAGLFARADRAADGAGDDRGGGRGDAARRRAGGRRRAAASAVLARAISRRCACRRSPTGMARGGRSRENFDVHGGGFVATGPDEAAVADRDGAGSAADRFLWFDAHLHADPGAAWLAGSRAEAASHVGGGPLERHGMRRCRTMWCGSSLRAARIHRSPARSSSAMAARRIRWIWIFRRTRQPVCSAN